MQDFLALQLPNTSKVICYTGSWQAAALQLQQAAIYIQPWDKNHPALQLCDAQVTPWKDLAIMLQTYKGETESNKNEFINYVNTLLEQINKGNVLKVVPARSAFYSAAINPISLFNKCLKAYPNAHCYLLHSAQFGTWMGASPELFLNYKNGHARTMALAGTINPALSDLFSAKEFEEQNLVVKHIGQIAEEFAEDITIEQTQTQVAGHLKHLRSNINMQVSPANVLQLIKHMHPTAAVGGLTQQTALKLIEKHEKLNRELYAGWIGIVQEQEFTSFVNLRCCQLFSNGILCYAGCGVNKGSIAENEYQETQNKMNVMRFLLEI